jgi:hypothetical protein
MGIYRKIFWKKDDENRKVTKIFLKSKITQFDWCPYETKKYRHRYYCKQVTKNMIQRSKPNQNLKYPFSKIYY